MQRILEMERKDSKIRTWFWVASILLLCSYLVTLFSNKRLLEAQQEVSHTYEVINGLESLFSSVKDAETNLRGFVISKEERFAASYKSSLKTTDSLLNSLEGKINDNLEQKKNMDSLRYWIKTRLDVLGFGYNEFVNNNWVMTDKMVIARPQSINAMETVKAYVTRMEKVEEKLLKERSARASNRNNILDIFTFCSIALALGILSFAFITYRREFSGRKRAYKEVREYQEELKKQVGDLDVANRELIRIRSLEKFAATGRIARQIAHEVRNPLTNINLANNQLKEDIPAPSEDTLYLFDMIARNSERINNLISELLRSTKFQDLHFSDLDVTQVLEHALTLASDRISLNKIKVVKDFSHTKTISADEEKLKMAFLNLIVNALEAMEGQDNGVLNLETGMESDRVKITIRDNGRGMNEEALSRIFEPYFTTKQKGNGLGLTNTQNIILNHRGEINVYSKTGDGTAFTIYLG